MQDPVRELWRRGHTTYRRGKLTASNGRVDLCCGAAAGAEARALKAHSSHVPRVSCPLSSLRHIARSQLQLRKIIFDNFGEWGPIENVHLVPSKTLAFVR